LLAKSLYKAIDADLMIQFTVYTQARIVRNPPPTFLSIVYMLTEFEQVPHTVGRIERFIGTGSRGS
jgi:hypothetical protein